MRANLVGFTIGFGDQESPKLVNCIPVLGIANVDMERNTLAAARVQFEGDVTTAKGMVTSTTLHNP